MAANLAKDTMDIMEASGGAGNIAACSVEGGMLRFVAKDPARVGEGRLHAIGCVQDVRRDGDAFFLRIQGKAPAVLERMRKEARWAEDAPAAEKPEGSPVKRLFQFIAECMTPLLPAMLGAGMLKVVLTLCTTFGWLSTTESTYTILYAFGDSFFQFLPVFMGLSIARRNGGSAMLCMLVGASLCYPDLLSLMGGSLEPLGTFLGMPCTYLFGLPVICATYTSSVLPMLLMAPVMKWAEDFAERVSPSILKSFLKPLLFILICIPCVMYVLGPIGNLIGTWLAAVFSSMYAAVPWLTVGVLAAACPFLVMTGMHFALVPLMFNNIATLGYDVIICVTMFCSNIAQGGAALGVCARTRREDVRADGLAAGISACIGGITEPAMYGINIPYVKPMGAAVAAAAISGILCGVTGVRGYVAGGSPSFLTVVTFIGGEDPMSGLLWGLIGGCVSLAVSFILAFVLYRDPLGVAGIGIEDLGTGDSLEFPKPMPKGRPCEALAAPVSGEMVPLDALKDAAFFSGMLGKGVAIRPADGSICSPCDGTVTAVAGSGHAVSVTSPQGAQVLIHVGVDTAALHGKGFRALVKAGDPVLEGQKLIEANLEYLKGQGADCTTPVVVSNAEDFSEVAPCAQGTVRQGEEILLIWD